MRTSQTNHRRVLILKDSFGNALPGYLFYSFEEIHVVDFRYFAKNMKDYVRENKITDILFANNIFNAYSNKICNKYVRFLNQPNGFYARSAAKPKKAAETAPASPQPKAATEAQEPKENPAPEPQPAKTPEPKAEEPAPSTE